MVAEALSGIPGLEVTHRVYPDLTHGGLVGPSVAAALDLHLQVTG